ncbi:GNAT family N-acetyltransferase [Pseudoflavitalea sp. G-6-1-2]|uniref:GNAT family N-acetyltransferase n=1 Tax=Pseudoflavitalea sp. G-6-1-2 TaxID=2728841 RepID=UPI00146AE3B8|nr:GNAT family N-acetyltransferase [Pseudoflavitalea sp. G-6-1-2]NML21830.1 GNAT family N-acetyltransferase [Pseudoflavitalea sp. G-6-1-2]
MAENRLKHCKASCDLAIFTYSHPTGVTYTMIHTERLHIMPLSVAALELYLQGNNLFELKYGLAINDRLVAPEVRRFVHAITLPCMRKSPGDHYLFFTFWLVIEQSTGIVVAELGFKGVPNPAGMVEIGYGTMPEARKKGFMTEAVGGLINWASTREDTKTILAETANSNTASMRVLQKNGFEQFDQRGDMLWWRKSLSQNSGFTPV